MAETEIHQGGCQCGRVRYRVSGPDNNTSNCHCSQCQMAAGAAFVTWSEFPIEAVSFDGDPLHIYSSSKAAERGFCPTCGTTLTFRYLDSKVIDIATATLDNPGIFVPTEQIWVGSKVAWVKLDDTLPQYPRERGSD